MSGWEQVSARERAVAKALFDAGRLQPEEGLQLLVFAQQNQLVHQGSYLCGALIRAGRISAQEADRILLALSGVAGQPEAPGGTIRMPPGSQPLPIPGAPSDGGDEVKTRRHDSARLARELAAEAQGFGPQAGSGVFGPQSGGAFSPPPSSEASDDGEQTLAFDSIAVPGPRQPTSDPRPPSGSYAAQVNTSTSGVYGTPPVSGRFPQSGFGDTPSGRLASPVGDTGSFGIAPSGRYGSAPSGSFGGAPSGSFGGQPTGSFGGQPTGSFGGQPSGQFGAPSSTTGGGGTIELDLEQLGLAGDRYQLDHRPAPGYWEGRDRHLERRVVLRVAEADEVADDSFWRHARVLALLDQAGVREVHDMGVLPGRGPFYCLDPIEGVSLEELVKSERCPPLPTLLRALIAVSASLQHAHERGVVHARLGPSLIRLGAHGQVYVSGWESASFLSTMDEGVKRRIGPPPPIDPSERRVLAPELSRPDARLSARTDVHSLGRLLYWVLAGRLPKEKGSVDQTLKSAGAPRELIAVTRKALSVAARERYPGARHFADDLRRFLDGEAVLAERDPPLRAAIRLAKRYPLAAAIVCLFSAVALGGASITYRAVRARANRANDAKADAKLAADEAEGRRKEAEAQLELAKRRAAAGKLVRAFENALEAARRGGKLGARAYAQADRLLGELKERTSQEDALLRSLRLRLLLARGRDRLYSSSEPRPEAALEDFLAVTELAPDDPRGHYLVYEAARRLPGDAAKQQERDALAALGKIGGVWGELGRVGETLQELELKAEQLVMERPLPRLIGSTREVVELSERLERLSGQLGDVSQTRTWKGRLGIALTGPGLHRAVPVVIGSQRSTAGQGDANIKAIWSNLFWAILLDPTDPEPRAAYTPSFFAKWGQHALGRHKGGWPIGSLARICRTAQRHEPTLELCTLLTSLGRIEATLPILERALALPDPQPARDPTVRARLLLMRARARLKLGEAQPDDVRALDLPSDLRPEADVIAAWTFLSERNTRSAMGLIQDCLRKVQEGRTRNPLRVLDDLCFALSDARAAPTEIVGVLQQMIPPGREGYVMQSPIEGRLRLALAIQLSRIPAREAAGAGFNELQVCRASFNQAIAVGPDPFYWSNRLSLIELQLLLQVQPNHPQAHLIGVQVWANLCRGEDSSEPLMNEVERLIVERLTKLGNRKAARAFELTDAPTEFLPTRRYTAPEVWDWRGREDVR